MQIFQTDHHERPQLLLDDRAGKKLGGATHRHVHHLGDVHAADGVLQCLGRVAQAVAGLAGGLDIVHKCHFGHYHALAATHRAAALAVEGELLLAHLVGACKHLADVGGNVDVGGRRRAQTHADVALADVDHGLLARDPETLHERTLAGARHTGDNGEHAQRQVDVDRLEVVQRGAAQGMGAGGSAWRRVECALVGEHLARAGAAVKQGVVGTLENHLASRAAGTGTHVHDVVGKTDHLLVMLD